VARRTGGSGGRQGGTLVQAAQRCRQVLLRAVPAPGIAAAHHVGLDVDHQLPDLRRRGLVQAAAAPLADDPIPVRAVRPQGCKALPDPGFISPYHAFPPVHAALKPASSTARCPTRASACALDSMASSCPRVERCLPPLWHPFSPATRTERPEPSSVRRFPLVDGFATLCKGRTPYSCVGSGR
jgi:hypothetical protein